MTLITVLTPAYNAAATIERTIASVAAQVGVEVQHIVIDDASTDDTAVIAGRAGAEVLFADVNGGPAAALNLAIPHVRGEYVITLEADDYFELGALAGLTITMQRNAGIAFAYGQTRYYGALNYVHAPRFPATSDQFYDRLESLYAVMFHRDVFDFPTQARWHTFRAGYGVHDWDFVLQLVECGWKPALYHGLVLHYEYKPTGLNSKLIERNAEYLAELKARHPGVRAVRV